MTSWCDGGCRLALAEEMLLEAAHIYRLSFNPNSNFQSLMRATLGTFYREAGKPLVAIEHLSECIDRVCELRSCETSLDFGFDELFSLQRRAASSFVGWEWRTRRSSRAFVPPTN